MIFMPSFASVVIVVLTFCYGVSVMLLSEIHQWFIDRILSFPLSEYIRYISVGVATSLDFAFVPITAGRIVLYHSYKQAFTITSTECAMKQATRMF